MEVTCKDWWKMYFLLSPALHKLTPFSQNSDYFWYHNTTIVMMPYIPTSTFYLFVFFFFLTFFHISLCSLHFTYAPHDMRLSKSDVVLLTWNIVDQEYNAIIDWLIDFMMSFFAGAEQQRVRHRGGNPEDAWHNQGMAQLSAAEGLFMQLSGFDFCAVMGCDSITLTQRIALSFYTPQLLCAL